MINQLLCTYDVKKPELRPYHDYAQKLIGWLDNVTLQHVPRKENKKADALVALALTLTLPDQAQIIICQKWIVPPCHDPDNGLRRVSRANHRTPLILLLIYSHSYYMRIIT